MAIFKLRGGAAMLAGAPRPLRGVDVMRFATLGVCVISVVMLLWVPSLALAEGEGGTGPRDGTSLGPPGDFLRGPLWWIHQEYREVMDLARSQLYTSDPRLDYLLQGGVGQVDVVIDNYLVWHRDQTPNTVNNATEPYWPR